MTCNAKGNGRRKFVRAILSQRKQMQIYDLSAKDDDRQTCEVSVQKNYVHHFSGVSLIFFLFFLIFLGYRREFLG